MSNRCRSVRAQVHHDRLLQALWPFGCSARMLDQQFIEQQGALDDLARWIVQHPARVTCITGPSGAGKSTLLARIEQHLGKHGARADRIAMPAVAVGALGTQPLAGWLSRGQQRRLQVALAIDQLARHATSRPITLLIDEVASGLDRMTLGGVLRTLARLTTTSHRPCVQLIVCGCDEQLPWRLMDERYVGEACGNARLVDGCRSWARGSRVTRGLAEAPPAELLRACAWRASHHKGVYVHEWEAQ